MGDPFMAPCGHWVEDESDIAPHMDFLCPNVERMPVEEKETTRADGTWERAKKGRLYRRLRLRRADGRVYLDRWGIGHDRIGRILIHRMSAPDPGLDLHDHPWWFVTIPIWGGYVEQRNNVRTACADAKIADEETRGFLARGRLEYRRVFKPRVMRLDECHRVTHLIKKTAWTIVIGGPRVRMWGFYLADGWVDEPTYDRTVRAERRDLWGDIGESGRAPWK